MVLSYQQLFSRLHRKCQKIELDIPDTLNIPDVSSFFFSIAGNLVLTLELI